VEDGDMGVRLENAMNVDAGKLICKYTNLRSILNKKDEIGNLMNSRPTNLNIFGVAESWAHNDINDDELHINGFNMFRKDRIVGEKARRLM